MQLKKYYNYRMNFRRNWTTASGALMGMALFARMVHYFGLTDISRCGMGELIFSMFLPLLLSSGFIILLRFVKLDSPWVFGVIGAAMYLLVMINTFFSGDVLRIVLSVIAYILAIFLLLATAGGFLPDKIFVLTVGFLIPLLRYLLYELGGWLAAGGFFAKLEYLAGNMVSLSDLAMLLALFCLPMCMKPVMGENE